MIIIDLQDQNHAHLYVNIEKKKNIEEEDVSAVDLMLDPLPLPQFFFAEEINLYQRE